MTENCGDFRVGVGGTHSPVGLRKGRFGANRWASLRSAHPTGLSSLIVMCASSPDERAAYQMVMAIFASAASRPVTDIALKALFNRVNRARWGV
jgi:hypothetical protein